MLQQTPVSRVLPIWQEWIERWPSPADLAAEPSGEASAAPSGAPPASGDPGTAVSIVASGVAFTTTEVTVAADTAFVIVFENQDDSIPHNVQINDAAGAELFVGEVFPGVDTRDYQVQALPAGEYPFICTVHPNMTGTLTAE